MRPVASSWHARAASGSAAGAASETASPASASASWVPTRQPATASGVRASAQSPPRWSAAAASTEHARPRRRRAARAAAARRRAIAGSARQSVLAARAPVATARAHAASSPVERASRRGPTLASARSHRRSAGPVARAAPVASRMTRSPAAPQRRHGATRARPDDSSLERHGSVRLSLVVGPPRSPAPNDAGRNAKASSVIVFGWTAVAASDKGSLRLRLPTPMRSPTSREMPPVRCDRARATRGDVVSRRTRAQAVCGAAHRRRVVHPPPSMTANPGGSRASVIARHAHLGNG